MQPIRVHHKLEPGGAPAAATLTLAFEVRQRSRFRAALDDGREVEVVLPRGGGALRGGDRVGADGGLAIEVRAAPEPVSTASSADPLALCRAGYHLGNRHVPLEIGAGFVRYRRDHVLDRMVEALGVAVRHELAPFEPEAGAYGHGH